jgi:predicted TIM-barrel fold metal-dependent hydrolase
MAEFPPPGATDCHVHVIAKQRFPLPAEARYTPSDAPVGALAAMLKRLGLERVVVVQPSFYGTDNACTLSAIAELGLGMARGVAVLPDQVSADTIDAFDAQGIRGLRVNIATHGTTPVDDIRKRIEAAAATCAETGWHVQIFVPAAAIEALAPTLGALPVDTVIDHFGLTDPDAPDAGIATLVKLIDTGKVWVKISGAYRITKDPTHPGIDPVARALVAANPERIVWGSDWPHTPTKELQHPDPTQESPFQDVDAAGLLALLPRWLEDDALIRRVLVDNPARLYGFD